MSLEPDTLVRVLLRGRFRMAAIAMAILRDKHAVDDIFQQVVLAALERIAQFHDEAHVLAWGVRAARFRAIDLARQRRLRTLSDTMLDRLEARWANLSEEELPDNLRVLHECLDKLSAPARELLRLRYDEGLSVLTIAERLQRNVNATYQSLSRIHRALRDCARHELLDPSAPATRESHR